MRASIPEFAIQYGFLNDSIGAHSSRTLMLAELRRLLAACPPTATWADYRHAILADNALLKNTVSTRHESLRRLRELYGLDPDRLVFRALRALWADEAAQPLLALLCAVGRDPVLRGTAGLILSLPRGNGVTAQMIAAEVQAKFPDQFNPATLAKIGRNAASSWQQAGHLRRHGHKVRAQAVNQPTSTAYALLLGYLCGGRGDGLFDTLWAQLLDAPSYQLREQALAASKLGWLEYRQSGDITEVNFQHLLRGLPA